MALQNMQVRDPAAVEDYKTELTCTNLQKLLESALAENVEGENAAIPLTQMKFHEGQ